MLNVRRRCRGEENQQNPPAAKLSRVEVRETSSEPAYDYYYEISCLACSSLWSLPEAVTPGGGNNVGGTMGARTDDMEGLGDGRALGELALACARAVIASAPASKREEAAAWREEVVPCEHSRALEQSFDPIACRLAQSREQCGGCELRENLWMCLTCGSIGCGRRQFDGSGGRDHGLGHWEGHQHPLAVKLGTLTAEGGGDVYCYPCGEMRTDPCLPAHLAALGIDVATVERTERTMAELQLEQNLKFDFSMVSDDGQALAPATGPHCVGLRNLGNSCYFNSVIQSLFHLAPLREAYAGADMERHIRGCHKDTPACFVCQAGKVQEAMLRGAPAIISPWMLRAVVATGHAEFATARQQDASEFLAYLLKVIQRSEITGPGGDGSAPPRRPHLTDHFTFTQQQRLECSACGARRHQRSEATQLALQLSDVLCSPHDSADATLGDRLQLTAFLERYFGEEPVDGGRCRRCGQTGAQRRSLSLLSTPRYLVITLSRYVLRNWVPHKIDMAVSVPFTELDLSAYRGERIIDERDLDEGRGGGETLLAANNDDNPPPLDPVEEVILAELTAMGFPPLKCRAAIRATTGAGLEGAMNWVLEHGGADADVDAETGLNMASDGAGGPIKGKGKGSSIESAALQPLIEAGFSRTQAMAALEATDGNVERAFDWILSHLETESVEEPGAGAGEDASEASPATAAASSQYFLRAFISHKGPSVHCGHYIAHVLATDKDQWIMFNDERVVHADGQPPEGAAERAYVFIYERR